MRTAQEIGTRSFNMKREPMGHEPDRNDWLGTTLRRSDAASPDACIDAETLAAWADGGLSAQAAAAVESHASSCSRCMAVLAAMERTAPAAVPRLAWTPARFFRWLVPLTAAATAIAIWVLVPDRQMRSSLVLPVENSQTASARVDATSASPTVPSQAPQRGIENRTENPAPGPQTRQPQAKRDLADADSAAKAAPQSRDEFQRERAAPEAVQEKLEIAETRLAAPSAPPPSAASPSAAADAVAGAPAVETRLFAVNRTVGSIESISPSNPLNRWRVVSPSTIERSTDGGKTWTKTVPPPAGSTANAPTILSVRAVDDLRAVARTSEGTEFYTLDAGLTWTRVQENSAAPF